MSQSMIAFAVLVSCFLAAIAYQFFKIAAVQWKIEKDSAVVPILAGLFMILLIIGSLYFASTMN